MTTLKVPDMHCVNCVKRIQTALTNEGIKFEISLEHHTVSVEGDEQTIQKACALMDDLGFDTVR